MPLKVFLFLIIFLEGYVVLSAELLALRLIIPFAGNATDTAAIIIAAVLMPLALGYYIGGNAKPPYRRKLIFNLSVAGVILAGGLSHNLLDIFFGFWSFANTASGRLLATTAYALVFLVVPIFLLGQTVPLVSHYLKARDLSRMTGRILFFSTMGSFAGAIICTILLMPSIGVNHSADITIAGIALMVFMLSPRFPSFYTMLVSGALVISLLLNSNLLMQRKGILSNNQYNTVQIAASPNGAIKFMKINNTTASAVYTQPGKQNQAVFPYIDFIEKNFIYPTLRQPEVKDILVVGAGGLTLGLKDDKNNYVFLDIDPALDRIAREELLNRDLTPNKKFIGEEARAWLPRTDQKFDFIFLDIYQDETGVPMHTVTQEFLQQIKAVLKPGGIIAGNFFAAPNFNDAYSIRLDQTVRSVFPSVNRQVVPFFNAWNKDPTALANIIYVMYDIPPQPGIYTDNLNRSFLDKGKEP